MFIGGRSGAGKTSVGCETHAKLGAAGVSHRLIDGDVLDMACAPPWEDKLAERNLAAIWRSYRALGYHRMIYTNTVSVLTDVIEQLTTAMGDKPKAAAVLLTCTDTTARERLGQREIGSALDQHLTSGMEMAGVLAADVIDIPGWRQATP